MSNPKKIVREIEKLEIARERIKEIVRERIKEIVREKQEKLEKKKKKEIEEQILNKRYIKELVCHLNTKLFKESKEFILDTATSLADGKIMKIEPINSTFENNIISPNCFPNIETILLLLMMMIIITIILMMLIMTNKFTI